MAQAAERGAKRIRVHTLTDGRDTEDGTSVKFMRQLDADLKALEAKGCDARVASGGGRMIVTMDRYEARPVFAQYLLGCRAAMMLMLALLVNMLCVAGHMERQTNTDWRAASCKRLCMSRQSEGSRTRLSMHA